MITLASIMNLAGPDMVVILLIILVFFGAKRLPGLARGMGQAVKEFHKAKDEFGQDLPTTGSDDELRRASGTKGVTERAAAPTVKLPALSSHQVS